MMRLKSEEKGSLGSVAASIWETRDALTSGDGGADGSDLDAHLAVANLRK